MTEPDVRYPWTLRAGQCYEMKLTDFRFGGKLVRWCTRPVDHWGECRWEFRNIKGRP